MPMTGFSALRLHDWQQFGDMTIHFDDRVTIITGPNGTGKSTVLRLLASHFGWEREFYGSPEDREDSNNWHKPVRAEPEPGDAQWREIGRLAYEQNSETAGLRVRESDSARGYNVFFFDRIEIPGIYIPAQRLNARYSRITEVSTSFSNPESILGTYAGNLQSREQNQYSPEGPFPNFKKSLLTAAMLGGGSEFVKPQDTARIAWQGYSAILRILLPGDLGFRHLDVVDGEVVVRTRTGEFILDELSGGLSALAELAWVIHLKSLGSGPRFTVLIDEPENHLHPALQRSILPALLDAFPEAQFIVATHSPFVASSVETAVRYFLHYGEDGLVTCSPIAPLREAPDVDSATKDFMQLDTTVPIWAEERFHSIIQSFEHRELNSAAAMDLRRQLAESGLDPQFQHAMAELIERLRDGAAE